MVRTSIAILLLAYAQAVTTQTAAAQTATGLDPTRVRTAEACRECHVAEYEVWRQTPHAKGFKTLHRKEAAEAIAGRLGLRLIKRDSPCLSCHYTKTLDDGRERAASGVSCESCHGAAAGWIDVHNDYGIGVDQQRADHRSESAEHRAARIEKSRAAGMRRPSDDLYAVASSCYGCHTVPDERLVNVGGHGTGSADFELFAWSQGEIRHNFLDSFLDGDGTVNAERPPPRRRQLYLLGRALELEHALRGMAAASEKGVYASAMSRRLRGALGELRAIGRRAELPEVASMLATVRGVEAVPGNRAALVEAADAIAAAAREMLEHHDGSALASLDPLLDGSGDEVDEAVAERVPDPAGAPAVGVADSTVAAADPEGAGGARPGAAAAVPAPTAAAPAAASARNAGSDAVPVAGAFKRRVRPPSRFGTVGPGRCTGCHRHQEQAVWWDGDAHSQSEDPFFEEAPKNVQIATLYGLGPGDMLRGDQVCADCHATVVTGKEKREIREGVGCESCHGPAAQYLDPHQEGDASLGETRPGYRAALGLGMVELRDLEQRAAVCTGCHYVTEPRLISAGHPSGKGFDYLAGMGKIRHWQDPPAPAGELRQAFAARLAARGAVPDVPRARPASRGSPATGPVSGAVAATTDGGDADRRLRADDPRAPRRRSATPPARPFAGSPARSFTSPALPAPRVIEAIELPPFPELEGATIEDSLLRLRERLRLLYRTVAEGGSR